MGWMDEAMEELRPWIGRVRIGRGRCRPDGRAPRRRHLRHGSGQASSKGSELPPHWFTLFFGRDGAAERDRPRRPSQEGHRAAADPDAAPHGRRPPGQDHGPPARRRAGGQEGRGRRHRSQERPLGRHLRADHAPHHRAGRQDASRSTSSTRSTARPCRPARRPPRPCRPRRAPTTPGATRPTLTNTLNFRYSALTWNAHRIHYDGDYTRSEEGYPALVSNGGLSHAPDGRCRAASTARARSPATPRGSSIRCGSAT